MRYITAAILMAVLAAGFVGCNTVGRQPQFREALLSPEQLKPGDSGVVSVEIKDKHGVVDRVEGFVADNPDIKFKLKDDGVAPDEKAGDSIWTLAVDVPFHAPTGNHVLELTAYRADGTPVPIRNAEGDTVPLSAAIPVIIVSP